MSKERFVLQPSNEMQDGWVATDTENGIVLRFENHKLEQTMRCTPLLTDGRSRPQSSLQPQSESYSTGCEKSIRTRYPDTILCGRITRILYCQNKHEIPFVQRCAGGIFLCSKNHRKYAKLCDRISRIKHGILYIIFIVVNT